MYNEQELLREYAGYEFDAYAAGTIPMSMSEWLLSLHAKEPAPSASEPSAVDLQAELAQMKAKLAKAEVRNRMLEHSAQVHEAQYRLERENSKALASALMHSAPEAWHEIKDTLNQSNNERDKMYCEVTKRFNRLTEAEAENENLRAALEPFAAVAAAYDKRPDSDFVIDKFTWTPSKGTITYRLCVGDLNRARQALAAVGKTAEGGA